MFADAPQPKPVPTAAPAMPNPLMAPPGPPVQPSAPVLPPAPFAAHGMPTAQATTNPLLPSIAPAPAPAAPMPNPLMGAPVAAPAPVAVAQPAPLNPLMGAPVATQAAAPVDPLMALNEGQLAQRYIELRDRVKAETEAFNNGINVFKDEMSRIESLSLARLNAGGVDSFRTGHGTVFKKLTTRYSVDDPETFKAWVMAQGNVDMFPSSVKQESVRAYIEEHNAVPPGLKVFSEWGVQFRK